MLDILCPFYLDLDFAFNLLLGERELRSAIASLAETLALHPAQARSIFGACQHHAH